MKHEYIRTLDMQTTNDLVIDRLVKEKERKHITTISRAQAHQLEKEGRFPKRRRISNRSVAWLLSELHEWVKTREAVLSPSEETM